MNRAGQTWKLSMIEGGGYAVFTVLSTRGYTTVELEHSIVVLDLVDFEPFGVGSIGIETLWWESTQLSWENDIHYARLR